MTTNYPDEQGKKLFGIGVLLFGDGFAWFRAPGILTLLRLSDRHGFLNIFHRAEIVIGVIVATYGMLVWRSAFRKLFLANYIIVSSCVSVFLLCVSKMTEWVYFLDQQSGFSILNVLKIGVSQIAVVVCIMVFGAWWADSIYLRERFHARMRSSRFVK
jgi:magnesium-transporting ATPase (P-type)